MTKWISATISLLAFMLVGVAAIDFASAAPLQAGVEIRQTSTSTDLSARRRTRYAHRPYDESYYYDRPHHYAPAPFVPFNYGYYFWPWR